MYPSISLLDYSLILFRILHFVLQRDTNIDMRGIEYVRYIEIT